MHIDHNKFDRFARRQSVCLSPRTTDAFQLEKAHQAWQSAIWPHALASRGGERLSQIQHLSCRPSDVPTTALDKVFTISVVDPIPANDRRSQQGKVGEPRTPRRLLMT
ncbi:hypothetical protein MTP99_013894 [Tenebrio molitor]|nr:hypothetical protein MTP99_013894 [Tenebrio molitor]